MSKSLTEVWSEATKAAQKGENVNLTKVSYSDGAKKNKIIVAVCWLFLLAGIVCLFLPIDKWVGIVLMIAMVFAWKLKGKEERKDEVVLDKTLVFGIVLEHDSGSFEKTSYDRMGSFLFSNSDGYDPVFEETYVTEYTYCKYALLSSNDESLSDEARISVREYTKNCMEDSVLPGTIFIRFIGDDEEYSVYEFNGVCACDMIQAPQREILMRYFNAYKNGNPMGTAVRKLPRNSIQH